MEENEDKKPELNTPKDLILGTILVEGYCNMLAFYVVIGTTEKSVLLKEIMFDSGPDPAGYPYVAVKPNPDRDYLVNGKPKIIRKYVKFLKDGGFWIPGPIDGRGMSIYNPKQHYSCYWD